MRIGIDARLYRAGLGIGRYVEQLLLHIDALTDDNEYFVFLRKDMMDRCQFRSSRIIKVCVDIHWYSVAEQLILPFFLMRFHLDLVHFPHFNIPILYLGRFVVTIHDLIMIKHPASSTSAASTKNCILHRLKYLAYRFVLNITVWRARKIIAVSYYVKRDLIALLRCPENRIEVIYEGVSVLRGGKEPLPHRVRKPYLLNVGNAYPHKNLSLLLNCADLFHQQGINYQIVLCGQQDYFQRKLQQDIECASLSNHILHLGTVSDAVLSSLYTHATAAVFPSFEEGFGFGALEAASHGTPVIATNDSVFSETLGDAFYGIDPTNPHDILYALECIERNGIKRMSICDKARWRSRQYNWVETAKKTQQLYQSIL